MRMIYLAHPFQGKPENVADAERIILELLKRDPNTTYLSPLHATGFYYFAISYEQGMEHCFEALRRCDALCLCNNWENSKGCCLEVEFAEEQGIPVYRITEEFEIVPLKEGK